MSCLLFTEIFDKPIRDQLSCLVDAGLDGINDDFDCILRSASVQDVDSLVSDTAAEVKSRFFMCLYLL